MGWVKKCVVKAIKEGRTKVLDAVATKTIQLRTNAFVSLHKFAGGLPARRILLDDDDDIVYIILISKERLRQYGRKVFVRYREQLSLDDAFEMEVGKALGDVRDERWGRKKDKKKNDGKN